MPSFTGTVKVAVSAVNSIRLSIAAARMGASAIHQNRRIGGASESRCLPVEEVLTCVLRFAQQVAEHIRQILLPGRHHMVSLALHTALPPYAWLWRVSQPPRQRGQTLQWDCLSPSHVPGKPRRDSVDTVTVCRQRHGHGSRSELHAAR